MRAAKRPSVLMARARERVVCALALINKVPTLCAIDRRHRAVLHCIYIYIYIYMMVYSALGNGSPVGYYMRYINFFSPIIVDRTTACVQTNILCTYAGRSISCACAYSVIGCIFFILLIGKCCQLNSCQN